MAKEKEISKKYSEEKISEEKERKLLVKETKIEEIIAIKKMQEDLEKEINKIEKGITMEDYKDILGRELKKQKEVKKMLKERIESKIGKILKQKNKEDIEEKVKKSLNRFNEIDNIVLEFLTDEDFEKLSIYIKGSKKKKIDKDENLKDIYGYIDNTDFGMINFLEEKIEELTEKEIPDTVDLNQEKTNVILTSQDITPKQMEPGKIKI